MTTSSAQHGSFCFAQGTDEGKCHLSLNGTGTTFNVQIQMEQVPSIMENLTRVLENDRRRLAMKYLEAADQLDRLKRQQSELVVQFRSYGTAIEKLSDENSSVDYAEYCEETAGIWYAAANNLVRLSGASGDHVSDRNDFIKPKESDPQ